MSSCFDPVTLYPVVDKLPVGGEVEIIENGLWYPGTVTKNCLDADGSPAFTANWKNFPEFNNVPYKLSLSHPLRQQQLPSSLKKNLYGGEGQSPKKKGGSKRLSAEERYRVEEEKRRKDLFPKLEQVISLS